MVLRVGFVPCVAFVGPTPISVLRSAHHNLFLLSTRHPQQYHHFVAVPTSHHAVLDGGRWRMGCGGVVGYGPYSWAEMDFVIYFVN